MASAPAAGVRRRRARTAPGAAEIARTDPLPAVSVADEALEDADAVALAIPVVSTAEGPRPGAGAAGVAEAFGLTLADELALASATGAVGEAVELPVADEGRTADRLFLVGTGEGGPVALRRAGAALARKAGPSGSLATTLVADAAPDGVRAGVEGLLAASYRIPRRGVTAGRAGERLRSVRIVLDSESSRGRSRGGTRGSTRGSTGGRARAAAEEAVRRAVVTARALAVARDLGNTSADLLGPGELAAEAVRLATAAGLEVWVRDAAELRAEGFGGLLAVGGGSVRPPALVEITYLPRGARRARPVVLAGKGIAFDSGGLSLKPREAMVPMKTDMAGAAAVLAAMTVLPELAVRVPVTGLLAIAENLPGAAAYRPGDVITHYGGRTSEVLNTDAEGRLVLADALAYADTVLDPEVVVDIATLTGAASLGLGKRHGALFSPDDRLAAALAAAGDASGERLWRMPLVEDYRPFLDSTVADVAHVPHDPKIGGGAITAALFLREFVGRRRWAHLDVAGPARADSDEHEVTKGATGFGTRVLLRWLEGLR